MHNTHSYPITVCMFLASILLLPANAAANSTQIEYSGKLIARPCTIEPGQQNQSVDMGSITTKNLYRYTRTEGKIIQFELKGCDTSLGMSIVANLTGTTNADGLLAFSAESEASGAGIGLEYLDGRPISLNSGESLSVPLRDGDMTIRMRAYVQGESAALANKTLEAGFYSAILTYTFDYN